MTGLVLDDLFAQNRRLAAQGVDQFETSFGEAIENVSIEAGRFNPLPSLTRQLRRQAQELTQPAVPADELNAQYGIEGELRFADDLPDSVAREIYENKRAEIRRRDAIARHRGGAAFTAASIGVGLAASVVDPLNVAASFIPVVGEARFAIWTDRVGRTGARAARGSIEGAAGAALLEPLVLSAAQSEAADYDAMDSLLNIAFGTALGGGLHVGGGALGDALGRRLARHDPVDFAAHTAGTRTAVAELAESGTVRSAGDVARAESAALGAAWDEIAARPIGPENDPLVVLRPSDIEEVLVQRGRAELVDGEVRIPGRGTGLVKFIFRHGPESSKPPAQRLKRDDAIAFPEVLRLYETSSESGVPGREGHRREWRVPREGRTVVYGTTRFGGAEQTVTMHIEPEARGPLSQRKSGSSGSPARIMTPGEDTARGLPDQPSGGRTTPAPESLGRGGDSVNRRADNAGRPAAARESLPASRAAAPGADPDDVEVSAALDASQASVERRGDLAEAEAALADAKDIVEGLKAAGLLDESDPELAAIERAAAAETPDEGAYAAAAQCLARGVPG